MSAETVTQSIKWLAKGAGRQGDPLANDFQQWIHDHTGYQGMRVIATQSGPLPASTVPFRDTQSLSEMMRKGHGIFDHCPSSSRSMGFFGLR